MATSGTTAATGIGHGTAELWWCPGGGHGLVQQRPHRNGHRRHNSTSLIDDKYSKDYRLGGGEMFGRMLQVNVENSKNSFQKTIAHPDPNQGRCWGNCAAHKNPRVHGIDNLTRTCTCPSLPWRVTKDTPYLSALPSTEGINSISLREKSSSISDKKSLKRVITGASLPSQAFLIKWK